MLAKVFSGATVGLDSVLIEVEVDVPGKGLPGLTMVTIGRSGNLDIKYKI